MGKPNLKIIRELAKNQGLSLKNISDKLGISPAALQNIMRNNGTSLETLGKLAEILGVSVGVFFGEKNISPELLNKIMDTYICAEDQGELIQTYNFIENMMSVVSIEDKNEVLSIIEKKLKKIDNYKTFVNFQKLTDNDINELLLHLNIEVTKAVLKLAVYRTIYKRSNIEHFAEFWFKAHNEPNRFEKISLKE